MLPAIGSIRVHGNALLELNWIVIDSASDIGGEYDTVVGRWHQGVMDENEVPKTGLEAV